MKENTDVNLHDLGFSNGFLGMTPKARATKQSQINWTSSKLKYVVLQITPPGN